MLEQHRRLVRRPVIDQQQPGRAVAPPVPVTLIAPDPAVAVMLHDTKSAPNCLRTDIEPLHCPNLLIALQWVAPRH